MNGREQTAAVEHAVFGLIPALLTGWLLVHVFSTGIAAVDFRSDFWVAGARVLHGGDPYSWTLAQVGGGVSFPYPAFAGLVFAPFALLSRSAAGAIFTVVCLVSLVGTLRVLGVRDWRIYGIALLWSPVVSAWQTANLTLPLAFGIALSWRYRDRPAVAGLLAALLVCIKPVAWPWFVWLLATRRYAALGWGLAVGAAVNAVAWAIVGFGEIGRWLHMLKIQMDVLYDVKYGLIALGTHLGLGRGPSSAIQLLLTAGIVVACIFAGRRWGSRASLTIAVALMLISSPQVDSHYFALLIVPLALARPILSTAWVLPLVLWACPTQGVSAWESGLFWLTTATLVTAVIVRLSRPVMGDVPRIPANVVPLRRAVRAG